jgi:non-ribosomal peptide synthetase-like protein
METQTDITTTEVSSSRPRRPRLDARLQPTNAGCLHELFEAQVDLRPEAPALISAEGTVSYAELDASANRLARLLRHRGLGPGNFVAIYFERSTRPIVSILACLKAGVAYVPVDPSYPADRIRHIREESELVLALTEPALAHQAGELFGCPILDVDAAAAEIAWQSDARISRSESGVSPDDLCYVIYTSGSTGRPKGVMAVHGGAYRFTLAFNEVCATSPADRVYQGFSLGFDGSVEEIWMAFSNGSALVVPSRDTPRFGNDLGAHLEKNGVTYFSTVPTLLSTIADGVPSLRCLVVSGEICSSDLVSRWARPGLRMLNVYGPTEATVNTTAAECVAGRPVTIGRPLRGYELHVLDPEQRPVARGEKGELYVGGETLARGYLKQPALTAEKFVEVPAVARGRIYRTGDLVRWNEDGELEFFGRIDSQVKIRGYRVELAEIEAILLEHERIRSAAVVLAERDGMKDLAAFVVLNDPSSPLDRAELRSRLEKRVPVYMIPGTLDVLAEFPMLSSGKVDRKFLPPPSEPFTRSNAFVAPESELERTIEGVWAKLFGMPRVSIEDDFFLDLGGHSLVAAQMVTQLRTETRRHVTVRDAYRFPTIRKLARHLEAAAPEAESRPEEASSRAAFESVPALTRLAVQALQAVSLILLYGIAATLASIVYLIGRAWVDDELSLLRATAYLVALTLAAWPTFLVVSIAGKWLVIGRYKPGRYPLWGWYYFRFWLAGRLQALSGALALSGTPLMPFYWRLMGAKVGRGCTIDTASGCMWDLTRIGDDTTLSADVSLTGYRVENGMLLIGPVEIGSRCFVGIHSALGLGARMGDDSRLDDQSLLPDGQSIPAGESRRGSPAQPGGALLPEGPALRRKPVRMALAHLALIFFSELLFIVPSVPFLVLYWYAFQRGISAGFWSLGLSIPVAVIVYAFTIALVKRAVSRGIRPGVYVMDSAFYLRKWFADGLMKASRAALLPVYTTMYLPPLLRLLGAKIGKRVELSTVWQFSPELIDVGEESFFADGSIVGGRRPFRGRMALAINRIGRRSFVGNSAVLPVGASLGDGCLLGVQSVTPAGQSCTPNGSEWLGSPAFSLPHRKKIEGFSDAEIFRPTLKLYLQRAAIDLLRILIPYAIGFASFVAFIVALDLTRARAGLAAMFALSTVYAIALAWISALFVIALKWAVMGRFQPVIRPLWSMYVWLNEMVNGAYESVMSPAIAPLLGTPFVAVFLRLIGCKIGKRAYLETTLFSEFDLVEVGDYAALNAGAIIQNHLFEDRVMKSSFLKIGDECTVGNMAVVLYDSEMGKGSVLGPLSLLMKGERLAPGTRWHGIPTQPASAPVSSTSSREGVTPKPLRTELAPQKALVAEKITRVPASEPAIVS